MTEAEAEAAFGPVVSTPSTVAPPSTTAPTTPADEPEALALANEPQGEVTTVADTTPPESFLSALPPAEAGVCVVLEEFLDIMFEPGRAAELVENSELSEVDEVSTLLRSLDDGPFGAEWIPFAEAFFPIEGQTIGNQDDFGPEWIAAADQLSQDQCGYPAVSALMNAVVQDCFVDGARSEAVCQQRDDPR